MSGSRGHRLIRLYPPRWRARYGRELESLIVESNAGRALPWRTRFDLIRGALREHLRGVGLSDGDKPGDRVRGGALLVLCAWALFVIAGCVLAKFSEHWQAASPNASRGLPSLAFDGLGIAALIGGLLLVAGLGAAVPSLIAFLRGGGWPQIRRGVIAAALLTALTAVATVALSIWAHQLTVVQRNGSDLLYGVAFFGWALLFVASVFAWTAACVATAGRLKFSGHLLRIEARIAAAVAAAMVLITAAMLIWALGMANDAPWFLAGRALGAARSQPGGPNPALLAPEILGLGLVMALCSALGIAGSVRALRALPDATKQR